MSYVNLGYGSSSGGGGSGIVAVPQDANSPGAGARVWLHNNMADLATVYDEPDIYPPDDSTDPATVDPRTDLTAVRAWQFSDATPAGYGVNFPMAFATEDESSDIDAAVTWYPRTVMKFTGEVTAKMEFIVTIAGGGYSQQAGIEMRQIQSGADDLIVNQGHSYDLLTFNTATLGRTPYGTRARNIVLSIPWRNYENGDLVYVSWNTDEANGNLARSFCQAEYVVH